MANMRSISLRIISKNVRYATKAPSKGERSWTGRKELVINELRFNSLHIQSTLICCQEVLHQQLQDILKGLQQFEEWDYIGWGRDDGKTAGEYSPILFRPAVWTILEKNPIWLSPTPNVPSKDPEAATIRILTRAKLKHISSGITMIVYCTHLDHLSGSARQRAANQICLLAYKDSDLPIILAGDFNSEQNQEAYQTIVGSKLFQDASNVKDEMKYGNSITYTGFAPNDDDPPTVIDYIFHSTPTSLVDSSIFRALGYAVLPNSFDDGTVNSDHRAIVADILLGSKQNNHAQGG